MRTADRSEDGASGRAARAPCAFLAAAALTGMCVAYLRWVRPWHLAWGATEDEQRMPMPGDQEVPEPHLVATRAIWIAAPPEAVWPWLVQMGYKRAGFYSYRLDNAWVPSPWEIVPELQDLNPGDVMPTGPGQGFTVKSMEPGHRLLLVIDEEPMHVSASILLDETEDGRTRMTGRVRVRFGQGLPLFLYRLLFDLGDFIMMRKMFLGIRGRAERFAAVSGGSPKED